MDNANVQLENINQSFHQLQQPGSRSYPAISFEITLLSHAQQVATLKEIMLFKQLCDIFDWQLPRQQHLSYLTSLKNGLTLILTDFSKTIVWASQSILSLTGYASTEVIGNNPNMLQGDQTDQQVLDLIRTKLKQPSGVKAELINYRKNREPYLCSISIDPLHNSQGILTHFLAVEYEVK